MIKRKTRDKKKKRPEIKELKLPITIDDFTLGTKDYSHFTVMSSSAFSKEEFEAISDTLALSGVKVMHGSIVFKDDKFFLDYGVVSQDKYYPEANALFFSNMKKHGGDFWVRVFDVPKRFVHIHHFDSDGGLLTLAENQFDGALRVFDTPGEKELMDPEFNNTMLSDFSWAIRDIPALYEVSML